MTKASKFMKTNENGDYLYFVYGYKKEEETREQETVPLWKRAAAWGLMVLAAVEAVILWNLK